MTGHMTALLIGDTAFCSVFEEQALAPLGVLAACAGTRETAAVLARALQSDLYAVVVRLPAVENSDPAVFLQAVTAFCDTAALPLITVGAPAQEMAALNAGAFHHLLADAPAGLMTAVVGAATRVCQHWRQIETERRTRAEAMSLITAGTFRFRTPTEAGQLAVALSSAGASPQRLALGLLELMLNAIEHGNLGIGFAEKSRLRCEGRFAQEVEARLVRPENRDKWAIVTVAHDDDGRLSFTISDDGNGFNWRDPPGVQSDLDPALHGRGILLARSLGFEDVRYEGCGNRVRAVAERAAPTPNA